mmetsp:Transcript_15663/g.44338  ORF Transcript_15663/g.44338 Transcript_15663/m.44338 type:complete len:242 (+) Transcript_15663:813-1538(+)
MRGWSTNMSAWSSGVLSVSWSGRLHMEARSATVKALAIATPTALRLRMRKASLAKHNSCTKVCSSRAIPVPREARAMGTTTTAVDRMAWHQRKLPFLNPATNRDSRVWRPSSNWSAKRVPAKRQLNRKEKHSQQQLTASQCGNNGSASSFHSSSEGLSNGVNRPERKKRFLQCIIAVRLAVQRKLKRTISLPRRSCKPAGRQVGLFGEAGSARQRSRTPNPQKIQTPALTTTATTMRRDSR